MDNKCSKCGMETEGFKCDMCGAESATHDEQHEHGGEHCMPKCKACGQAQVKCTCQNLITYEVKRAALRTQLFCLVFLSVLVRPNRTGTDNQMRNVI